MQDDEQEIRQLVSTWMAASKAGDVEKSFFRFSSRTPILKLL